MCNAGGQLSLLFEDLFKKMNGELLMEARKTLAKAARTTSFDAVANLRSDIITHAMEAALSTGCWNIKRFRMDRKGATQVCALDALAPPLARLHWFCSCSPCSSSVMMCSRPRPSPLGHLHPLIPSEENRQCGWGGGCTAGDKEAQRGGAGGMG